MIRLTWRSVPEPADAVYRFFRHGYAWRVPRAQVSGCVAWGRVLWVPGGYTVTITWRQRIMTDWWTYKPGFQAACARGLWQISGHPAWLYRLGFAS